MCIPVQLIVLYIFIKLFFGVFFSPFSFTVCSLLCFSKTRLPEAGGNKTIFWSEHSEPTNKRSHLKGHVIFAHPLKLIITIIPQ